MVLWRFITTKIFGARTELILLSLMYNSLTISFTLCATLNDER